jgi:hypothetical protein
VHLKPASRTRAGGLAKMRHSGLPRASMRSCACRNSRIASWPRICELVEYYLEDIVLKGAWIGPAALSLTPHALAPVAELPVLEVMSAIHIRADLTLGLGKVVRDYLRPKSTSV